MLKNKQSFSAVISYLAILSLIIMGIYFLFFNAYFNTATNLSVEENDTTIISNNNANQQSAKLQLDYDPLVTLVPEELQSSDRNAKFFISRLDPKNGSEQAKVLLFVFSSFANQDAKDLSSKISQLRSDYTNQELIIIWKDLVDPSDKNSLSWQAGLAAHCANEQDKFWEYHDALFTNSDTLNTDDFAILAQNLDLDQILFSQCIEDKDGAAIMQYNYNYAKSQGITAVPTVYVDDVLIEDLSNIDNIKTVIDQKLASYNK